MSIRDTSYTNPDALRTLYRNPKNPLKDLDEELAATAAIVASAPTGAVGGAPGSGGGGGGGGWTDPPCPAFFEFTWAYDFRLHRPVAKFVQDVVENVDRLWSPIAKEFRLVTRAEHVYNVECVRYRTMYTDVVSVVSLSHPVIQDLDDDRGRQILDMLQNLESGHRAVSAMGPYQLIQTGIEEIASVGKNSVVKITLEGEGGGIYASGSHPERMNLGHNIKNDPPGQGGPQN